MRKCALWPRDDWSGRDRWSDRWIGSNHQFGWEAGDGGIKVVQKFSRRFSIFRERNNIFHSHKILVLSLLEWDRFKDIKQTKKYLYSNTKSCKDQISENLSAPAPFPYSFSDIVSYHEHCIDCTKLAQSDVKSKCFLTKLRNHGVSCFLQPTSTCRKQEKQIIMM